MEAQDPLADLADIHLPGPVSFWPPAPGWWVLAFLVLVALVFAGIWYFRRWQRLRRLDGALSALNRVYANYKQNARPGVSHNEAGLQFLHGCNEILKRVALNHFPQAEVASLNGLQWLQFLDRTGNSTSFSQGEGKVLGDGVYRRQFAANADAIHRMACQWIKQRYHDTRTGKVHPVGAGVELGA